LVAAFGCEVADEAILGREQVGDDVVEQDVA
jgi:hypothetical protein